MAGIVTIGKKLADSWRLEKVKGLLLMVCYTMWFFTHAEIVDTRTLFLLPHGRGMRLGVKQTASLPVPVHLNPMFAV